jgi:hypothetical protein
MSLVFGGAVLHELVRTHPDLNINATVRSEKDLNVLEEQYSYAKVKTLIDSLNDTKLMESLTNDAAIVLSTNPCLVYREKLTYKRLRSR